MRDDIKNLAITMEELLDRRLNIMEKMLANQKSVYSGIISNRDDLDDYQSLNSALADEADILSFDIKTCEMKICGLLGINSINFSDKVYSEQFSYIRKLLNKIDDTIAIIADYTSKCEADLDNRSVKLKKDLSELEQSRLLKEIIGESLKETLKN